MNARPVLHWRIAWAVLILVLLIGLAACTSSSGSGDAPLPTPLDLTVYPTALFLTANAPPAGFGEVTAFDAVDHNLALHQGWAYTITGQFDGLYDVSGEPVTGLLQIQVQGDELSQARWVVLEAGGNAFVDLTDTVSLQGVRFANDYYMVDANQRCTVDPGGQMVETRLADLGAAQIIGGVTHAVPTGFHEDRDGLHAWQYTFTVESMQLPAIHQRADSRVTVAADLWIAPEINAVLVYEVNATVARVHLLWADQTQSTVSGTLYLRYELDIASLGTLPNISIPFGC